MSKKLDSTKKIFFISSLIILMVVWLLALNAKDLTEYYMYSKNRANHGSKIEHGCVVITLPRGWSIFEVVNSDISTPGFRLAKSLYTDERYFLLSVYLSKELSPDHEFAKTISRDEYAIKDSIYSLYVSRVEFGGQIFFREILVLPEYDLSLSSPNLTERPDDTKELIDAIEIIPGCKAE